MEFFTSIPTSESKYIYTHPNWLAQKSSDSNWVKQESLRLAQRHQSAIWASDYTQQQVEIISIRNRTYVLLQSCAIE